MAHGESNRVLTMGVKKILTNIEITVYISVSDVRVVRYCVSLSTRVV